MSEPVTLSWIEVEGFRGFAEQQRFDLNASVVIISGPNGTGKTSFFDAFQWLFLGSLERLEPWRLRRNTEHIVNRYWQERGLPAVVTVGMRIGDRTVELSRRGRHDKAQLEWRDGNDIRFDHEAATAVQAALLPTGKFSLRQGLLSSGLLQQDVIRGILEDKPAARYDQLSAMLGLDEIAGFPIAARKRADQLETRGEQSRSRLQQLQETENRLKERVTEARMRAETTPAVEAARGEFAAMRQVIEPRLRFVATASTGLSETQLMFEGLRDARDSMYGLRAEALDVFDAIAPGPSETEVAQAEDARDKAALAMQSVEDAASELREQVEQERRVADRLARLAADALPLIDHACPVCRQAISEPGDVRRHLEHLLNGSSPNLANLEHQQARLYAERGAAASRLSAAEERLRDVNRRRAEEIERTKGQSEWSARLHALQLRARQWVDFGNIEALERGEPDALESVAASLDEATDAVEKLLSALGSSSLVAVLGRAQAELTEIRARVEEAKRDAADSSAAADEGRTLQRAAVRAASSVTGQRFDLLRPLIQDMYSRLDPHPAFTGLKYAIDVYREKGVASAEVIDRDQDVSADPLLVFSSAQANVVALSTFLALGWAAGDDAMPFLLLDDPLQSLDDVNALGFADLCRHLRHRRQLIMSTHDARLASLLERKLAPRVDGETTRGFHFVAWSRQGPLVDRLDVPSQSGEGARRVVAAGSGHA